MKIGISGPILLEDFQGYIASNPKGLPLPQGLGGTPVNLIAMELLRCGHEVIIFSLDPAVQEPVALKGNRLTIHFGPFRPRAHFRAFDFFRTERHFLRETIRQERPDIVHAHWTYEFALGALESQCPTVITVHDWAPQILEIYRNLYRFLRFLMDRRTFRKGKHFVAISPYIQEKIRNRWGLEVPLIPNPIEDAFLRMEEKMISLKSPIILSINQGMSKLKNVETLLLAFKILKEKLPECRLKLIGDDFGPGGRAELWARSHGLNEGISYVGPLKRNEISKILDEGALLVHPSLEESFGLVLIEAMARRTPVLGGQSSGAVPWVLDFGKAGMLCDVQNPDRIAASILEIIQDETQWRKFSLAGFSRVRETFSLAKVVDLYLEHYCRVINK